MPGVHKEPPHERELFSATAMFHPPNEQRRTGLGHEPEKRRR